MSAYVLFISALVAFAAFGADAAVRTSCSMGTNYGPGSLDVYNTACTDQSFPYCSGNECGECSAGKTQYICDCPANHACVQAAFNPVRNAAFCAPLNASLYGRVCTTDADCTTQLLNVGTQQFETAITMPCKNGACVFCNPQAEQTITCQYGPVPDGTNDRGYGSKGGEGRICSSISLVWNSNAWPLASPLPTDPYYRERSLYASPTPTPSRTVQPSASSTSSLGALASSTATATPSHGASASATPTATLSQGASPSVTPVAVEASNASQLVLSLVLLVAAIFAL